ncbi:hypothetical protein Arcve_1793 [Archaeoglobus veneficus SNP6]|uniref:Uncharacterized protein n=1 Tax=Archaeoglobus veneficus (strain DSM 11195 / SNP6) TaxID=693661 RepID=F2KQY3_ARCVS|nr:hypothetical protein Arcve_1793 [Archaeoglobus veneficus SNP6]
MVEENKISSKDLESILEELGRKIYDGLKDALEDITTLQVVTVSGKERVLKVEKMEDVDGKEFIARRKTVISEERVIAKTIIELDGDIILMLPVDDEGKISVEKEIMELHEKNVKIAVENWREFLKGIMSVCTQLMEFLK